MQSNVVENEDIVRNGKIRIQLDRCGAFLYCFLIFSQDRENNPRQKGVRYFCSGIGLFPQLAVLFGLFHISGYRDMKGCGDEILLSLTGMAAEFVCLPSVVGGNSRLSEVAIHAPQHRVGKRETRIELDGVLEKRNRGG